MKKHRFFKFFVLVTVFLTAAQLRGADNDTQKYLDLVGEADSAVAAGDLNKAQECYVAAMRLQPDNPSNLLLLTNLGIVQHRAGDNTKALETLTQAHEIGPNSVTVLANRGQVYYDMQRYDEARADFDRVLELDSLNTTTLFNRGYMRMRTGDTEGAEADLRRLSELAPDDYNTVALLAVMYSNTDRPAEAIPFYTRLLEKKPKADTYAARAMCHLVMENLTEASEDIAAGMALEPDNGELYYCRAYLNRLRYLDEDARADAKKAEELGIDPDRIALLFQ